MNFPAKLTSKGTELPIMSLKGKPYLQVAYRLVWFREEHPNWGIETDVKLIGDNTAVAFAKIFDPDGFCVATGTKRESEEHFSDFIEKAETGAIGRALAIAGYGTQFEPDLDEGDRIVDAPLNGKGDLNAKDKFVPARTEKSSKEAKPNKDDKDKLIDKVVETGMVLIAQKKLTASTLSEELEKRFSIKSSKDLTATQAEEFLDYLQPLL